MGRGTIHAVTASMRRLVLSNKMNLHHCGSNTQLSKARTDRLGIVLDTNDIIH